jgi:PAS domain S-box-containing protein
MDAILDLDADLAVTSANPAAARVFRLEGAALVGRSFTEFLTVPAARRFLEHADALADARAGESQAVWLPDPLEARRADGERFAAEASLSRYTLRGRPCHTLILRDLAERLQAQRTIQYLQDELRSARGSDQVLGQSPAMISVLRDIAQVAATDASVLIQGETGTGKELVARAIHEASPRKQKPHVCVNCAAIPANLIESEFFGHERGAFTGATQRRDGRFLLADRGTLFLDEVGELPLDLQVKLLRALQEGEFEPVGGDRTIKVDVRVVAATNRDLAAAVQAGTFRQDLYYRLSVFPIRVPPLRERREDIDLLAQAFAVRAARRCGKRLGPLSAEDLGRLRAYPWPGNVRELENVIERAVITATDGGRLDLDRALPPAPASDDTARRAGSDDTIIRTAAEFEQLERANLLRALESARWRIAGPGGAAELLAVNPSTLRSRMKALGIERSPI